MQPNSNPHSRLPTARAILETHGRHVLAYYGHLGGITTWNRYRLVPYSGSYLMMIDRETGTFKAFLGASPYNLTVDELDMIKRKDWSHD